VGVPTPVFSHEKVTAVSTSAMAAVGTYSPWATKGEEAMLATCDPDTGLAGGQFACKNMDLVNYLTGEELGSPYASNPEPSVYQTWVSDIWGWVDPHHGREYALVGMWDGTSIDDITDPRNPEVCKVSPGRR
jgi:hypothetical protein